MRTDNRYTQTIDAPPEAVFPLLCPVREMEWVDGWIGRAIHADSGLAEPDGVYATDHASETSPAVWVITRRDPATWFTEFVSFVPGLQVVRVTVALEPLGGTRSRAQIRYVRTGLSEAGDASIERAMREGAEAAMIREWELALNHYLATGEMLKTGPAA